MRQLTIEGREEPLLVAPSGHGGPERLFELPEAPRGSLALALDNEPPTHDADHSVIMCLPEQQRSTR